MNLLHTTSAVILLVFFACSSGQKKGEQLQEKNSQGVMLTATANEQAVAEGLLLLKQGGSAMDAALSVALAEVAATGGKHVSFAGIINLIYYEAKTGKIHNMNGAFNTLKYESDPLSIPSRDFSIDAEINGRSVLVPGFFKGVEAAHKRFGKLPFAAVMQNAIRIAEEGTIWTSTDSVFFATHKHILLRHPDTKEVFRKANGNNYSPGDSFKQPKLAETLKLIAENGSDYIYQGEWGKKFVATVRQYGGKLSAEDLEEYDVIWSEPVKGSYHGYDVYAHGYPSVGGASLIEALNLAEVAKFSEQGHYSASSQALYTLYLLCDATEYYNNTPAEDRLNKGLAKEKWNQIIAKQRQPSKKMNKNRSEHSANVVAIDSWGNMVALIHSINTNAWGSNGIFIDGISIPDVAAAWQSEIYSVGPGKRLVENTNPGVILRDGKPVLAYSCIGGGLNNQTLASIVGVLDFKITPEQVVQLPGFGFAYLENNEAILTIQPNKFSKQILEDAESMGAKFEERPAAVGGFWSAIFIDPETQAIHATPILYK
jgi:gamma-glutamyltranspeptidase / glutathione hydrolase